MIEATLRQIERGVGSINGLLLSPRLPAKASYRVSKLGAAMESEIKRLNDERIKIYRAAGCVFNQETQDWTHADALELAEARKQVDGLLDEKATLNAFPLEIEQFGNADVPGNAFAGLIPWAVTEPAQQ